MSRVECRTAFELKRIFLVVVAQQHWQEHDVTETGAAPPQIILILFSTRAVVSCETLLLVIDNSLLFAVLALF